MKKIRFRVKNTIKSHVIHNWKAKVMQSQKFEVMFNFENLYVQNTKCKIWGSFENLYYCTNSQVRGVCYPRLRDFLKLIWQMWLAKLCSCTGPQSNIRYNEAFGSINKLEGIKYTEMYKVRHNLRQVFCFHEGTLEKNKSR